MQKNLNIKHAAIQKERDAWEVDRQKIKDMVNMESEVVALNVGGTHQMMTERDILRQVPGSTLEKMFNGMHELKKMENILLYFALLLVILLWNIIKKYCQNSNLRLFDLFSYPSLI